MTAEPHITDHAVLRFLERAYGLGDFIAAVREEMRAGTEPAIDFGAKIVILHGCRLVIVDGVRVVTAIRKRRKTERREPLTIPNSDRGRRAR